MMLYEQVEKREKEACGGDCPKTQMMQNFLPLTMGKQA